MILVFILLWITRLLTTQVLLQPQHLLLMPPIGSVIVPYIVMFLLAFSLVFMIDTVRVSRQCPTDKVSNGLKRNLIAGLLTGLGSLVGYHMTSTFPQLLLPFISISILPLSTIIGEGFYLALIGTLMYGFSSMIWPLCQ